MLRFEKVSAGYQSSFRLSDISLSLKPGEMLGLIGPNGSGKSTLLSCAAGQLPLAGGRIWVQDKPLDGLSPRQRAKLISYMPQSRVVPSLTVGSLAAHGRYPHLGFGRMMGPEDRRAVDEALGLCGIKDLGHRPVDTLSGGQRQWAYLAMLLSQDTPVLLLDEPAAPLDVACQLKLMALLQGLCRQGRAVMVSLHDLNLAARFCDRLMLMENGHCAALDTPGEVFHQQVLGRVFGVKVRPQGREEYAFDPL